jgi:hypothetical protein
MVLADDSVDVVCAPVGNGLEEKAASREGDIVGVVEDTSSLIGENLRDTVLTPELVRTFGRPVTARSWLYRICSSTASFNFLRRSILLLVAVLPSLAGSGNRNSSSSSIDKSSLLLLSETSLS